MYTFRGTVSFILLIGGFLPTLPLAGQIAAPASYADDANPLGAPGVPKPDSIWSLDKASGAVTIRIAIPTVPANGRGPKIPFLLQYNSASMLTIGIPQPYAYLIYNDIWQTGANVAWAVAPTYPNGLPGGPWTATFGPQVYTSGSTFQSSSTDEIQPPPPSECGTLGPFLLADKDGSVHDLNLSETWYVAENSFACPIVAPVTTVGATSDGSAIGSNITGFYNSAYSPGNTLGQASPGTLSSVLYPDGTAYKTAGRQFLLEDSNGNGVQEIADTPPAAHWIDSTGRTLASSPFGAGTNSILIGNPSSAQYTVATTDAAGNTQSYVLSVGAVTPTFAFTLPHPAVGEIAVVGYDDPNPIIPPTPGPVTALNQLSLPDRTSYQFSYDPVYGTISKITFPQGGYIRFAWTVRPVGRRQQGNVIVEKQSTIVATDVYESDGVNPENHWIYSYADMDPSTYALVTTETATDGTVTKYTSMPFPMDSVYVDAAPTYLETLRQITSNSGALLETVATAYGSATPNASQVTETLWDGPAPMQSQTQYSYDKYDNVTEKDESKFYGCSSSSPCTNSPPWLRKTLASYLWSQQPSYETAHIVDKPVSVTVTDGSGNPVSETKYGYDEFALVSFTGAPNHDDSNYPSSLVTDRGNLTSVDHCAAFFGGSCSQWAGATLHYYDSTGLVVEDLDPHGNATNYYYDDQYVAGTAGGVSAYTPNPSTHSFVTRVTHVSSSFTDQYQYFWYTGELASHTDWNNRTTSYYYDDPFNRGTKILYPDSGEKDANYHPGAVPPEVTLQTEQSASQSVVKDDIYDGLGRLVHSDLTSDPDGPVVVDTVYDSMDRVYSRSNPYRSTTDLTYGLSTYSYDGLGRLTKTLEPDGTSVQIKYQGNETTTTDGANNSWSRYVDGAGRLTSVVEPGNLSTTYSYDPAGNLLCADQWGMNAPGSACAGVLSRNFSYDALSRLLTAFNPESGTTTYSYLNNGQLCAGDLSLPCSKVDATGQPVYYFYDGLNRLTWKWDPYDYNTNMTLSYDQGTNGIGRLTQENNQYWGGTQFSYDSMGRVTGTNIFSYATLSWQTGMGAQYDLAGNVKQLTYPDGRMVAETWDGAGRLQSITDATPNGPQTAYFSPPQSGQQYWPSGAVMNSAYGNGLTQTFLLNDRLQPCRSMASIPLLAVGQNGGGNLLDRSLYYSVNAPGNCGNEPGNNGNIWSIVDNLQPVLTQGFQYDNLNRLTQGSRSDGAYNFTYNYDSFGNMIPHDNQHYNPPFAVNPSNMPPNNQLLNGSSLNYYANGQLATSPGYTYIYTAEGYLRGIGMPGGDPYGVGSYLYNSLGQRAFAVRNEATTGTWDQFYYLNGLPMASLNMDGNWTDFIYANGEKIAKVDAMDAPIHISGVNCSNCGGVASYVTLASGAGHVIQPGDILNVTQYNVGGAQGGLILVFADGTASSGLVARDQDGQQINCDAVENQFHYRHIDLSAYAGETLEQTLVINDVCSAGGQFDQFFNDIAIVGAKGAVTTIYSPGLGETFAMTQSPNHPGTVTSLRAVAEPNAFAAPGSETGKGLHYYVADHLGTTQTELNGPGWPVWQGAFTPFGQEIVGGTTQTQMIQPETPDGTNMHYKFTGKERDSESGLDYFGARYYGSSMGRFMSPDPLLNSGRPDNPQTWNRYSYALNNPLIVTDPTGMYNLVNNCAGDDAKCNKAFAQDAKNLKNGLADLTKAVNGMKDGDQKTALQGALKAFGTENDGNNVGVQFGKNADGAAGNTQLGVDASGGLKFTVTFDPSMNQGTANQAINAAHEGQHVEDLSDPRFADNATTLSPFSLEYRGYQTSAYAASALGQSSLSYGKNGQYPIWNGSWGAVDRNLTNFITSFRDKSGQPDHPETTPHDPWKK